MNAQRRAAGIAAVDAVQQNEGAGNRACQEMHMRLAEVQAAEAARRN